MITGERGRIVDYLRTLADVHQKIAEETRTMSTEEESWVQVQSAMQYLISKSLRAVADRIEAENDEPTALFSECREKAKGVWCAWDDKELERELAPWPTTDTETDTER